MRSLSATQISLLRLCPRRFAGKYIEHFPDVSERKWANAGDGLHEALRKWLYSGELPPENDPTGWLLRKAMPFLPAPGTKSLAPEAPFEWTHDGMLWKGRLDLTFIEDGLRVIHDHKTMGNMNKLYMLTPEGLSKDTQGVLYDAVYGGGNILEWLYLPRPRVYLTGEALPQDLKGAHEFSGGVWIPQQRRPVQVRSKVAPGELSRLIEDGHRALKMYSERKPQGHLNDLPEPDDFGACEAFGGCPYKHHCDVWSGKNRLLAAIESVSRKEIIMGMFGNRAAAQAAPAVDAASKVPLREQLASQGFGAQIVPAATQAGIGRDAASAPLAVEQTEVQEQSKGIRGRPPGSKNKPRELAPVSVDDVDVVENILMQAFKAATNVQELTQLVYALITYRQSR